MKSRVCEILEIEKPVIQAPMAFITSPELVAAVSNAGGLGKTSATMVDVAFEPIPHPMPWMSLIIKTAETIGSNY